MPDEANKSKLFQYRVNYISMYGLIRKNKKHSSTNYHRKFKFMERIGIKAPYSSWQDEVRVSV